MPKCLVFFISNVLQTLTMEAFLKFPKTAKKQLYFKTVFIKLIQGR